MDVDLGEGLSDDCINRMRNSELNPNESNVTVKQEIKEEPTETAALLTFSHMPPTHERFSMETKNETDDQLNVEIDVGLLKEEIKYEDEEREQQENGMEESRRNKIDQSNEADANVRGVESLDNP